MYFLIENWHRCLYTQAVHRHTHITLGTWIVCKAMFTPMMTALQRSNHWLTSQCQECVRAKAQEYNLISHIDTRNPVNSSHHCHLLQSTWDRRPEPEAEPRTTFGDFNNDNLLYPRSVFKENMKQHNLKRKE